MRVPIARASAAGVEYKTGKAISQCQTNDEDDAMMRPGQLHPNEFEVALLERLALEHADAEIKVSDLHVLSRTFTGVGSFTEFLVKEKPTVVRRVLAFPALVTMPALENGLGVVAFREGGRLTLETYTFSERWDGVFDGFSIDH